MELSNISLDTKQFTTNKTKFEQLLPMDQNISEFFCAPVKKKREYDILLIKI